MKKALLIVLNALLLITFSSCGTVDKETSPDIAVIETSESIQEQGTKSVSDTKVQEIVSSEL